MFSHTRGSLVLLAVSLCVFIELYLFVALPYRQVEYRFLTPVRDKMNVSVCLDDMTQFGFELFSLCPFNVHLTRTHTSSYSRPL